MADYDFVAIGDVTTDAFIRLSDARVTEEKGGRPREICMRFGDKIPYDNVTVVPAVGNCANAAVAAARLGLNSALLSNHGNDDVAGKNLAALKKNGVATELLRSHAGIPSNYHFVLLFGAERTILVKHQEYPYTLEGIGKPNWIYVTSLGETSLDFHHEIAKFVKANPETKLVLQPGTFQMKLGYEKLKDMYELAHIFVCNVEEAQRILEIEESDIKKLLDQMAARGPKIVCITDGPDGAYAFDSEKGEKWFMPIYPDPAPPVDRTGAGDAFTSVFSIAIAQGKSVSEALTWGPIASMSVVQHVGAQEGLPSKDELDNYLKKAPKDYKPEQI